VVKRVDVPAVNVATIWSGGEDTLTDGPKFGAFARPLLSEVEATIPAAAPALKPAASRPAVPGVETVPESVVAPAAIVTAEAVPAPPVAEGAVMPLPLKSPARLLLAGAEQAEVGEMLTLTVEVAAVDSLYSAPLFVNYDPALVEFVDGQEGTFLGQGGQATVFSLIPRPADGQIVIGYKQDAGGTGASGDGTLVTLNFRGKAAGNARIELSRVNFRDPAGTRLDVEPAALTIAIK